MGGIGTERREVEFEPLPDDPVEEPQPAEAPAADVLVDAMRGKYTTWTRIRLNLRREQGAVLEVGPAFHTPRDLVMCRAPARGSRAALGGARVVPDAHNVDEVVLR